MADKRILFNKAYTDKLSEGIRELSDAVTSTLGPKGRTVLLCNGTASETITKDGVSVARAISFKDHVKNAGASLIKEAAERTNASSGDGTTTTTLLCSTLILEGFKLVNNGFSPNEVALAYKKCHEAVSKEVKNLSIQFNADDDMIYKIATVSANNDKEIGSIVSQAYQSVGDNGVVQVIDNHSKTGKTTFKTSHGLQFSKAIKSSIFATDKEKGSFEGPDPIVAVLLDRVSYQDFLPIAKKAALLKRPLVVFATDFDDLFVTAIMKAVQDKQFQAALILCPGYDYSEQANFAKDICAIASTKVLRDKEDIEAFAAELNEDSHFCGHVSSIVGGKTFITDPNSNEEAIEARVNELKAQIAKVYQDDEDVGLGLADSDIEGLKAEIATLTGGIATIMVGSNSSTATMEMKDRYEDAVHAVEAAINDGVVPGGGATLLRASKVLDSKSFLKSFDKITPSIQAGIDIYKAMCKEPFKRISASDDVSYQMSKIIHSKRPYSGFNAKTGLWSEDLVKDGIIDPARVLINALANSTEQAATVILSACSVSLPDSVQLTPNDEVYDRTRFLD